MFTQIISVMVDILNELDLIMRSNDVELFTSLQSAVYAPLSW